MLIIIIRTDYVYICASNFYLFYHNIATPSLSFEHDAMITVTQTV